MAKMIHKTGADYLSDPAKSICKGHPGRKAGPQSRESKVLAHQDRPTAMTLPSIIFLFFRIYY
jgi:hypothetical protein